MDRDGVLNFNEIKDMIDILIFVSKESSNSSNFKNVTPESVLSELYQRVIKSSPTINGIVQVCVLSFVFLTTPLIFFN